MPHRRSIQTASTRGAEASSPEQTRFAFLLAEVDKVRRAHAQLEATLQAFRQEHAQKIEPLRAQLREVCRECVFAIDRLLDQPGWAHLDRAALRDLLLDTAALLLNSGRAEDDIKAVHDKYSRVDFDTLRDDELEQLKEHAVEMGFDLGDPEEIRTEDDLMERMYEEMAAREAAEAERRASHKTKKKSKAQLRKEDAEKLAKEAIRELYRKLASAVHPDREHDPQRRAEKTELMQRINQAYAANDLMSLLETQTSLGATGLVGIASLGVARLKQYNKLLSEQLTHLKEQHAQTQASFCRDFGLPANATLTAGKLAQLIRVQARQMRQEVSRQQHVFELFSDKAATKRWLKAQRRAADRGIDALDDW